MCQAGGLCKLSSQLHRARASGNPQEGLQGSLQPQVPLAPTGPHGPGPSTGCGGPWLVTHRGGPLPACGTAPQCPRLPLKGSIRGWVSGVTPGHPGPASGSPRTLDASLDPPHSGRPQARHTLPGLTKAQPSHTAGTGPWPLLRRRPGGAAEQSGLWKGGRGDPADTANGTRSTCLPTPSGTPRPSPQGHTEDVAMG